MLMTDKQKHKYN